MSSERAFRTYKVDPWLKTQKYLAYFPIQQVAIAGDADYILCVRGHFVWLELKAAGEELRPLQDYKAAWVRKTGGIAIRCRPDNFEQVKLEIMMIRRNNA